MAGLNKSIKPSKKIAVNKSWILGIIHSRFSIRSCSSLRLKLGRGGYGCSVPRTVGA